MLDPGDELRLGFEAADELRVVGQRRADDLDRDLAPDVRLDRPVDDAEGAFADPLEQLQPAQRSPRDVESGVLREDLRLEAAQVGGRLQPELVHQHAAGAAVGGERVRLAA